MFSKIKIDINRFKGIKLGIEIGSEKIKIIRCEGKKCEITDSRIIDIPESAYNDEGNPDFDELYSLLRETIDEMKASWAKVYLIISSKKNIIRVREMPKVPLKEMYDMVIIDSDQFLPYSSDEFSIDYKVLEEIETENGSVFRVLVTAVSQEVIKEYINLMDKLKLKISRITIFADAVSTFVKDLLTGEEDNILVADIGANSLNMIIFRNGAYYAGLNSYNGYNKLFNMVRDGFNGSDEEVHRLIRRTEIFNEEKEQEEKIVEFIDELSNELKRMIDFYKTRKFGSQIHKVYLAGGGANIHDIDRILTEFLGVEVHRVSEVITGVVENNDDLNLLFTAYAAIIGGNK